MSSKCSLSATNLAQYHHLGDCELYLHNVYHQIYSPGSVKETSELSKAQFRRGNNWETVLFTWLDRHDLLLKVPSTPLDSDSLRENILADTRDYFFIAGLTFLPPQEDLNACFTKAGAEQVIFGLGKPDLLEISRTRDGVEWRVVDAKSSPNVQTSHHVQLYFYTVCLKYLLHPPFFRHKGSAAVWLPPVRFDQFPPSLQGLKPIDTSLFAPSLDQFLFYKLPNIISFSREEIKWHYNPLCRTCPYEKSCRTKTLAEGRLGSIPNISIDDAGTLKTLLRISSDFRPQNTTHLTDIEDLHKLITEPDTLERIAVFSPSTVKKSRRILVLPKKRQLDSSPVVKTAMTQIPQIKGERSLSLPRREDIAVIMSFMQDPSSPRADIERYTISIISAKPLLNIPNIMHGPGSDLFSTLAFIIRTIIREASSRLLTQFYTWSPREQAALQAHLINSALASTNDEGKDEDIGICIGALAEGASLLKTTFQPTLLSGALSRLSTLSMPWQTQAAYKARLERIGLSAEASTNDLRESINVEVPTKGRHATFHNEGRVELGQLPRVVVLKREVERLIALPRPGFWDLQECAKVLLPSDSLESTCYTDEDIFIMFQGNDPRLEEALVKRNASIYAIIQNTRARILTSGSDLLVNNARVLSSNFMDICEQEHLRKLFFMQQFEVLVKLTELWRSRIDGCPDAPVLKYLCKGENNDIEHVFQLVSGSPPDIPATHKFQMYDRIITLDETNGSGNGIPIEVLFDDLAVCDLVFPLNAFTNTKWMSQHITVRNHLSMADLQNVVIDGHKTIVSIRAFNRQVKFVEGQNYRLSPRLVDFNTPKLLAVLFEMDLRYTFNKGSDCPVHHNLPLLQMILDPKSFGRDETYLKTEGMIQKMFRDLVNIGIKAAEPLVLKRSQHQAALKILSRRLSVIWGPPGTGKTHTIALSLLRLLDVENRHENTSTRIIFITAMTYAAVEACRNKLLHLIHCYRAINSLPTEWLDNVRIEEVTQGVGHQAPTHQVHIYTGTIYQLYSFSKRHAFQVDCVVVDEAGQLGLSSIALVLRSLSPMGKIVVAGDSEQLAPILGAQYPLLTPRPLFGSVLDCLMVPSATYENSLENIEESSSQGSVIQLTENFRLNPDLGEFVSTIYSRAFKPQKVQARQLALQLQHIKNDVGRDLGVQKDVLQGAQKFLLSLSKVMLRELQNTLVQPKLQFREEHPDTRNSAAKILLPVSLTLITLRAYSGMDEIGPEVYVRGEAELAAALVTSIRRCAPGEDIFVAVPRRVQREAVNAALTRIGDDFNFGSLSVKDEKEQKNTTVTVDTIERLQGSEAAFVVCLFALPESSSTSDLRFLLERRRLNVAISRAKTLCVLISSPKVLRPSVHALANGETAKGYEFLRAYEDRAWSCEVEVDLDSL